MFCMYKTIMVSALAACGVAGVSWAEPEVKVELYDLRCVYKDPNADQNSVFKIKTPRCQVHLLVRPTDPNTFVSAVLNKSSLKMKDAKGKVLPTEDLPGLTPLGRMAGEDASKVVTLQSTKLPKGGSLTLSGTLVVQVSSGSTVHEPQAFDATKGGVFHAGEVSYTLAPGKADVFSVGLAEGCTAVTMTSPNHAMIHQVEFTTPQGEAVHKSASVRDDVKATYFLNTKMTDLRIVVSTYKEPRVVNCPVDMTLNLSGEVKKKEPAAEDAAAAKPQKKAAR